MALGGLWHGAGLQFLFWGVAHGALLAGEHALRDRMPAVIRLVPTALKTALTLLIVMLLWVPFRASSLDHTLALYTGLLQWPGAALPSLSELSVPLRLMSSAVSSPGVVLIWAALALAFAGARPTAWRWALAATAGQRGVVAGILLAMVLKTLADRPDQPFLYFQF